MLDVTPFAEVTDIAGSTAPLLERARGLVEVLLRWLPADVVWLTLSDPDSHDYAAVGSSGLEASVLDYLARPAVGRESQQAALHRRGTLVSVTELPVGVEERPTWAECLIPEGFPQGLRVPLIEPCGRDVGMLSVLFGRPGSPPAAVRDGLALLAPVITRGVSPISSLVGTARLATGASCGTVLLRDGRAYPLPGLDDDACSATLAQVRGIARRTLLTGQVYRTFLWPDSAEGHGYLQVTVLSATDGPALVLGTVLVTPDAGCHGLTRRELQVLGLVVAGRSNQQIAHRLGVTARTAAAHLEHILHKLQAPSRTDAAVRAEREGCYIPVG